MSVYILHFDRPYHHAKHYVGYAKDVEARIERHKAGNGARLIQVITEAGIGFVVARVWKGKTRTFERKIKDSHNTAKYCPICKE